MSPYECECCNTYVPFFSIPNSKNACPAFLASSSNVLQISLSSSTSSVLVPLSHTAPLVSMSELNTYRKTRLACSCVGNFPAFSAATTSATLSYAVRGGGKAVFRTLLDPKEVRSSLRRGSRSEARWGESGNRGGFRRLQQEKQKPILHQTAGAEE